MTVCYYITGHGLGHAIRSSQVIREIPESVRVIVRTVAPEDVLRSEIPGPFDYMPAQFDCGCVQQDSIHIRRRETLDRYAAIAADNELRLTAEADFLRDNEVAVVLSDIVPFAFESAAAAGIPAYGVTNFTWHDIYNEYVETASDRALVDKIASQYRLATAGLITPLDTPTVGDVFAQVERIPLIARRGGRIDAALRAHLGIGSEQRMAALYFGTWGLEIDWNALGMLADWVFLTWDAPRNVPANVVSLDEASFAHRDVAASVDAVVGKTGYGTCSDCVANDVPMVFIPRADFIEHEAIVEGMKPWGGAVPIDLARFQSGDWAGALQAATTAVRNTSAYTVDGALVVVRKIEALLG